MNHTIVAETETVEFEIDQEYEVVFYGNIELFGYSYRITIYKEHITYYVNVFGRFWITGLVMPSYEVALREYRMMAFGDVQ